MGTKARSYEKSGNLNKNAEDLHYLFNDFIDHIIDGYYDCPLNFSHKNSDFLNGNLIYITFSFF